MSVVSLGPPQQGIGISIPDTPRGLFYPQQAATSGLVELIALFPVTTYFFINAWTWGYEDILKAIARAFNTKVKTLVSPNESY